MAYDIVFGLGGGDMYGTSDQGQPITIYLEHPTIPHTYLGTTNIFNQGFAASSPHKRRWKTTTGVATHIVSTHAIRDASFVIAPTAMTADILATCSLMLGDDVMDHLSTQYQAHTATYSIADAIFMKSPHFVHYNL